MTAGRVVLLLVAGLTCRVLSKLALVYALDHAVLDIPNERSSHAEPTPRGGGVAIAATLPVSLIVAGLLEWIPMHLVVALAGGCFLLAAVGWIDDHRAVPVRVRILVHFIAAAWGLFWLGGYPSVSVGGPPLQMGASGAIVAAFGVVWAINAYNFMDGIDGIAASQALVAAGVGGALLLPSHPQLALASLLVAATSAGFLKLNWSPARIFMGDVASGMLGFCFGMLAVASENAQALPVFVWVILLGVFVFDSTVTLARRLLRRERIYMPHRHHAYQRAVQAGASHGVVTGAVVTISIVLSIIASWAAHESSRLPISLVGAFLFLATLYGLVEWREPMTKGGQNQVGP